MVEVGYRDRHAKVEIDERVRALALAGVFGQIVLIEYVRGHVRSVERRGRGRDARNELSRFDRGFCGLGRSGSERAAGGD